MKKIQVSLAEEQYARLIELAERRDTSVSELVRQAIEQVYTTDLGQELSRREVQRLGQTPLLIAEEEEEIGIRGPDVLAEVQEP
ncbi:MAG: ribbon-helix-helix protein, CopG family [Anaerolineae bacterium]|nr:ribbon-helix-helix protein, CopG family [Anaerolineae bacterium]NIO00283.1 ribbon-helix-helix protein, CopG family [Anaerolineae bacterium]NIQ83065.1 ribbon-helix-helix protein, CopG family [Anaerolineae bacterium]